MAHEMFKGVRALPLNDRFNKYYMRYREITESPIADFQFIDKSDTVGPTNRLRGNSFPEEDIKAMRSPKWHAKLLRTFSKTSLPINLYAFNANSLQVVSHYSDPDDIGPRGSVVAPKSDLREMHKWAGDYNPTQFETTFGLLPPNYENCLNFMFLQNEGDERVPMTPWIAAHRMIHALLTTSTGIGRRATYRLTMDNAWRQMQEMSIQLSELQEQHQNHHLANDAELRNKVLYAQVSSLASARHGKIKRSGEFLIELLTQLFLTGDFTLNLDSFHEYPAEVKSIKIHAESAKRFFKQGLKEARGQLIVF